MNLSETDGVDVFLKHTVEDSYLVISCNTNH